MLFNFKNKWNPSDIAPPDIAPHNYIYFDQYHGIAYF